MIGIYEKEIRKIKLLWCLLVIEKGETINGNKSVQDYINLEIEVDFDLKWWRMTIKGKCLDFIRKWK